MTLSSNPILLSDSYKVTHWLQYPPGTERIHSYFESRGGSFEEVFRDGRVLRRHSLAEIRERAALPRAGAGAATAAT
jgi:nicotinic acid phosphoribosyltransferase